MFATFRVRLQLLHVRVSCSTSSSLSWPNLRWDEKNTWCQSISIVSSDLASSWHKIPRLRRWKRVTRRMSKCVKVSRLDYAGFCEGYSWYSSMPYSAIPPRFLFRLVLLQPGLHHRRLPGRGTCHGKDFFTKGCSQSINSIMKIGYKLHIKHITAWPWYHDNPLHLLHSALAVDWVEESPAAKAQPVTAQVVNWKT